MPNTLVRTVRPGIGGFVDAVADRRLPALAWGAASCLATWIVGGAWVALWVGFVSPGAFNFLAFAVDGSVPRYGNLYELMWQLSAVLVVVLGVAVGLLVAQRNRRFISPGWSRVIVAVLAVSAVWVGLVVPLSLLV